MTKLCAIICLIRFKFVMNGDEIVSNSKEKYTIHYRLQTLSIPAPDLEEREEKPFIDLYLLTIPLA